MELSSNFLKFDEPSSKMTHFSEELVKETDDSSTISSLISAHHFNSKVLLLLPDTPTLPLPIQDILGSSVFYKVSNLPVQELCRRDFIQAFVQCGKFYALSCSTRLDLDNSCVFLPSGVLMISLSRHDYHSLGISGRPSRDILREPIYKYVVEVDTCQPGFLPSKKLYQNIHRSFEQWPICFDFNIIWEPYNKSICSSSVAKYFSDLGYAVTQESTSFTHNSVEDIELPLFNNMRCSSDLEGALEWLGMASLGVTVDPAINDTCDAEEDEICTTRVKLFDIWHVEGFFTPATIAHVIRGLRPWLDCRERSNVPWYVATVYSPTDTLVSWRKQENLYRNDGDNMYTVIVNREKTEVFQFEGSGKSLRFYKKVSNK